MAEGRKPPALKGEPASDNEFEVDDEPNLEAGPQLRASTIELVYELKLMIDRAIENVIKIRRLFEHRDDLQGEQDNVDDLRGELKQILSQIRSKNEMLYAYKEYERKAKAQESGSDSSDLSDSSDETYSSHFDPDTESDPSILMEQRKRLTFILGKVTSKLCNKLKSRRTTSEEDNPERCAQLQEFIKKMEEGTATLEEFYRI